MPASRYNMNYAVVILGAIIIFAGVWFVVDARKWFTGPKVTIDTEVFNVISDTNACDGGQHSAGSSAYTEIEEKSSKIYA